MSALGIHATLTDEFWGLDNWGPGYTLANGAYRVTSPTSELAAWLHPQQFSYVLRVDRNDPEVASIIRMVRDAPHARAIRILPGLTATELAAFADGAYEEIFKVALQCKLPIFVFIPGQVELMIRYLKKFPGLQFIVDHCGMPIEANVSFLDAPTPEWAGPSGPSPAERRAYFATVLSLAEFPNVALKWSHAQGMFQVSGYPFEGLLPYLRKAVDCYGANRIMWASDHGGNQTGETWGELLYYIKECEQLTIQEKEWLLGRTVRTILNWHAGES